MRFGDKVLGAVPRLDAGDGVAAADQKHLGFRVRVLDVFNRINGIRNTFIVGVIATWIVIRIVVRIVVWQGIAKGNIAR